MHLTLCKMRLATNHHSQSARKILLQSFHPTMSTWACMTVSLDMGMVNMSSFYWKGLSRGFKFGVEARFKINLGTEQ